MFNTDLHKAHRHCVIFKQRLQLSTRKCYLLPTISPLSLEKKENLSKRTFLPLSRKTARTDEIDFTSSSHLSGRLRALL